jgi:hypothetical protein
MGSPALLDSRFPLPCDRPFTTRQARVEGVGPDLLGRLVRLGLLRRPLKGVYVAAQVPDTRQLRGQAIALTAPKGSVVVDWSATWYWTGIDHPAAASVIQPLSVFRFRGNERLRNGLVQSGERWLLPSDVEPLDGNVSITRPMRTACDLARFSPQILALGGMDALARTRAFTVEELCADVERFRRQRGVVALRRLAPLVDPRSESPGESGLRFRWLSVEHLPPPELQIPVLGPDGRELYRIDLGVEALRFGAEYDGEAHHTAPADRLHDGERRDELKVGFGWSIDVFRGTDVYGQHEQVTRRLPIGLREARRTLSARMTAPGWG